MIGRKTVYDQTFLTNRVVYRSEILAVDALGPDDNTIPDIRLDVSRDQSTQYSSFNGIRLSEGERIQLCNTAGRAYNAHLELFVWFTPPIDADAPGGCIYAGPALLNGVIDPMDARCHATIRVWAWGGEDGIDPTVGVLPGGTDVDDTLSSSSLSSDFGRWTLAHEQSILIDTLIVLRDLPANRYRVTVDHVTEGAQVDIIEQHTE